MTETTEKFSKETLAVVGLLLSVLLFIVEPFVARQLWRWFVVPLGVPALTWAQAAGVNLLLNVWISRQDGQDEDSASAVRRILNAWVRCIVALCVGAAMHYAG